MSILTILCFIVGLILITLFAEKGELGWSTFVFLGFLTVAFFIDKQWSFTDLKQFMTKNTGYLIAGAIVYILVGVLWTIVKWKWYCRDIYKYYVDERGHDSFIVSASSSKARIISWMVWWPFSMGWFLLHDPITRFYNFLYNRLSRMFDGISHAERTRALKSRKDESTEFH